MSEIGWWVAGAFVLAGIYTYLRARDKQHDQLVSLLREIRDKL